MEFDGDPRSGKSVEILVKRFESLRVRVLRTFDEMVEITGELDEMSRELDNAYQMSMMARRVRRNLAALGRGVNGLRSFRSLVSDAGEHEDEVVTDDGHRTEQVRSDDLDVREAARGILRSRGVVSE